MNRINNSFEDNKKKLITFLVMNDPDFETSLQSVFSMIDNGADIVELGIPFSDPVAEGPVIQKANERAISSGFKIQRAFDFVMEIRKKYDTPLLFLTYFNIVFRYGIEDFMKKCNQISLDGLIIPDLPYEEQNEIKEIANSYGINVISLISPTSNDRIAKITESADEFIYCVSSMGVTGERKDLSKNLFEFSKQISNVTNKKKAIGFGISTPKQINMLKEYFDGVIVGSAFVKICDNEDKKSIPTKIGILTNNLKKALST